MDEGRPREQVREALDRHRDRLLASSGAVGVGVGKAAIDHEGFVIVVYLESKPKEESETVSVEGIPVVFRVVGEISLQPKKGVQQ